MTKDIHDFVLSLYMPLSKLTLLAEKSTIKLWDDLGIGGLQEQAMSVCWRIPWKLVAMGRRVKSPQIAFLFVQVNPQPKWPNISWNSKVLTFVILFVLPGEICGTVARCHKCLSACVYWFQPVLLERLDWWAVSNSHFPFPWWWW